MGGWGGEQTAGVRVHARSQTRCHISQPCVSIFLTFKDAVTVRNAQERTTVCQRSATTCTATACGAQGHAGLSFLSETNPNV